MKIQTALPVLALICLAAGCTSKTRSISNSSYYGSYAYAGAGSRELSEFDVLGVDPDKPVTEEDIQNAARQSKPVQLPPGSTIMLVQSGAVFPDGPMVAEMSKSFRVVPFTGIANEPQSEVARSSNSKSRNVAIINDTDNPVTVVPLTTSTGEKYATSAPKQEAAAYSRLLRLAAARAGASAVVCYWGILESGNEAYATKTISWVPVLNWFVLDERQHMRITLKVAVLDVPTGNWSVFSVQPKDTGKWSARSRREAADQKQVEAMKKRAYALAAQELVALHGATAMAR